MPAANKVAIPRLAPSSAFRGRRRSARACEACRQRKIKCDGKRPSCGQCLYHRNQCLYEDVKRVRDQKQLDLLTRRVGRYESLLRNLEGEVDAPTARRIRKVLKSKDGNSSKLRHAEDDSDSDSSVGSLDAVDEVDEDLNRNETTRAAGFFGKTSEVSWMRRLGDGVESRSSHEQTETASPLIAEQPTVPAGMGSAHPNEKLVEDIPIAMMNYHLDDMEIPLVEGTDPLAVPPREIADEYFNAYMTFVHPFFSAVRRPAFTGQYRQFYDHSAQPPRKWLAILNMIFAIGCRHRRLIDFANKPSFEEDLVFLTRARQLSLHERVLFEHTDLQQIQLELLVAVYLLFLGQINRYAIWRSLGKLPRHSPIPRASKFSSMALRSALSLGINLRLTDDRTHDASKEARCRLWWSIYSMEHLLTTMHGRASCVGEGLCSVHLPFPVEEENLDQPETSRLLHDASWRESRLRPTILESATQLRDITGWTNECQPCPSLFFHHLVDLTLISQAALNKVYSIEGMREGASQTEYRLQKYSLRLDRWLSKLPSDYRFTMPNAGPWHLDHAQLDDESLPHARERVCLAMSYYSACITLYRPCLTQTPSPPHSPEDQTPPTKFRGDMATNCLQAASSLLSILPDQPDLRWLARATPRWSVLHFLMQATTALLLGLLHCSFTGPQRNMHHTQNPDPPASSYVHYPPLLETNLRAAVSQTKKALCWIHTMAAADPASRRAFLFCDGVVRKIAPSLDVDLQGWPSAETLAGGSGEEAPARMEGLDGLVDFEGGGSFYAAR
ncbi:uncharacterized protein N7459_006218 [Penicillium hispanicum]|uniref:uncharacterized protein n=1 Tax=Penicillium hispanicum TaxID=1080232 RepID=UPI002540D6DD|nr:uncharacterized protein N7459_006218 [Penicillium hispanicum]KAJ5580233.1 hypothetical protein N7459_006218 [Penicillium hispanicum]